MHESDAHLLELTSSIDSVDMHKNNRPTILRKEGSLRRNLPILTFSGSSSIAKNSLGTNRDLDYLPLDTTVLEEESKNLPAITADIIARNDHYKSQLNFLYHEKGV